MNKYNITKIVIIFLLQLPALLWSLWSFKMHKNAFAATSSGGSHEAHFAGNKFLEHTGSGILTAGVCPLGKVGAWVIVLWSLIMISLLIYFYNKYTKPTDIKRINTIFGILNSVIMGVIFLMSFIMNRALFIRTLPFFLTQIAISLILLNVECPN
jgi:hypothetical protein